MTEPPNNTRITLLERVRDPLNQQAWTEFVEHYTPLIYTWAVRNGLQPTDASDVSQEVMTRLVKTMQDFQYDKGKGRFRGWLKTVTQNAVADLGRSYRKQAQGAGDTQVNERLALITAKDTVHSLLKDIEKQYEAELLAIATENVRSAVQPNTWNAYQMTAVEQQPSNEVAQQLGMTISEVYVAKSRVIARLRKHVERLKGEE